MSNHMDQKLSSQLETTDLKLFRNFKRQYQLVKKHYLSALPSTGVQAHFEAEKGGSVQFKMSDEPDSAKFWNLMRPFLNEKMAIYFRNVWNLIQSKYADRLEQNLEQQINAAIADIDAGISYLKNQDGKRFLPEKIYQIISASGYFFLDEKKKAILEELNKTPLLGQLLWFEFDNYHHKTFNIISLILQVIWKISEDPKQKDLTGYCIYCLRTDGSFSTEEHIYPESLGNDEVILQKGIVCKKCNNVFSELDDYLIKFPPIAFLRPTIVPFTKKGKFPQAKFKDVTIDKIHPTVIRIANNSAEAVIKETETLEDGTVKFQVQLTSEDRLDGRKLGRALFKIGLGMLAFLKDADTVRTPQYSAARDFTLHDKPFRNNMLVLRKGQPNLSIRTDIRPVPGEGTMVVVNIWGVIFMFNMEEQPAIVVPEQLKEAFLEIPLWEYDV